MSGAMPSGPAVGPCAGLRVVDLSTMVSGPMCGRILADFGADVIKVESLEGDMMRSLPPLHRGLSGYFLQYNRNKRGVALDLKSARGRALATALAGTADVLIENFRPGVAERLQLDHARLQPANPRLIYVSINGFGDDGPYAGQPAYDPVIQGLTGFMPVQGRDGPPLPIRNPVVDKVAAQSAAIAVLAALNHRHASGRGQRITVPMLTAWAAFVLPEMMHGETYPDVESGPPPARDAFRVLETSDGHVVGIVLQDSQFEGLCRLLGRADLLGDPLFATPAARVANAALLHERVRDDARRLSTADFVAGARAHGVPFAPVNDLAGFLADPQVRHMAAYRDVEDPELGRVRHLGLMAGFAGSPCAPPRRAPRLGEHTDEILGELGHAADELAAFRREGAIA
ncbi:MAG: CoA transferase [Reyranellaceae bacterium]